ncbi:YhdP family protein [Marinobacter sp.]|uniref:YhdP family protein n=1 Tax=Marinobacter sp. TaxID=50741 RepID=UPI00198899D2|nr:YhdP family protein [Marinobacter sp.]MBC7193578.1 TIGR02099 family protein [Marinobacter sp.]
MPRTPDQLTAPARFSRLAGLFASLVWWSLLGVLVLLALYAGIGRQLSNNIDSFRGDIESYLSRQLGHEVRIGALESRWIWLDPVIEAHQLRVVRRSDDELLGALGNLRIRLDTLASLARMRLVFARLEADRLDVTLRHTSDGDLKVKGAELPDSTGNRLSRWVDLADQWMSDPSVRITRVNLVIRSDRNTPRYVDIPRLDIAYRRGMLYASGRAMRAGTNQQLASFRLLGQQFFRGKFDGQVYLDLSSGRYFDGLMDDFRWRGLRVEGVELGGQAWFTFDEGHLDQVSGILNAPYLQLGTDMATVAPLEDIRARVGWRRTGEAGNNRLLEQGQLHIKELQWNWEKHRIEPFSLALTSGPQQLEFAGDGLALEALALMTRRLAFLPPRIQQALADYAPDGYLNHWRLSVPGPGEESFRLRGRLQDVGVNAHAGAPGVRNLNGQVVVNNRGGAVWATGEQVSLGFPELFADNWLLDRVQATVAWSLEDGITRIWSDDIRVQYQQDARLTAAFDLRLARDGEDNLGLRVGVENGDASMLADFVPYHLVDPGLYDWLTTAITGAKISEGVYFGHGQIGRGAVPGSFNSAMRYRFSNATIRYDEAWPQAENAAGEVRVHDGRTRVEVGSARVGGLDIEPSVVTVEPGEKADSGVVVRVRTGAQVPGEALPYWMNNSPLGEMSGHATELITVEGKTALDLDLSIPLVKGKAPVVTADIRPQGVRVLYPETGLAWEGVEGQLVWSSERGFSPEPLAANFMGNPVQVTFASPPADDGLVLRQTGNQAVARLLAELGLEAEALNLAGQFTYQAKLTLQANREPDLTFSSNLANLGIDWPAPLAKQAGEKTPLWASLNPTDEGDLAIAGYWGDRLAFNLAWRDNRFHRGHIALQVPEIPLPAEPGLIVSGPVEKLDPGAWQEALSGIPGSGNAAPSGGGHTSLINHLDLQVGELVMLGQSFRYVQVDARPENDGGWLIETRSPRATGRIEVPRAQDAPVEVAFSELKLARAASITEPGQALTVERQLDAFRALAMEEWPDIDIRIDDLQFNGGHLGRWKLQLRPEPGILRIDNLHGELKKLTLDGEMTWSVVTGNEISRFRGTLKGGGLQELDPLTNNGIPLRNKKTAIELDLEWPGRPDDFSLARLSGSVSLQLDDGVILEQNNTAQLFRIFNLLNTDTLWRRLQFDFSDLYEAGVAFDAISGSASITDGLLTWNPELQIVGPSGAFELSGTTNMAKESLNMQLVVVLPLTQNLPLAALLLGAGAPIGGALFVLDKILGDPLSKLASANYSVTGTWSEPKVELRGVFGAGN